MQNIVIIAAIAAVALLIGGYIGVNYDEGLQPSPTPDNGTEVEEIIWNVENLTIEVDTTLNKTD